MDRHLYIFHVVHFIYTVLFILLDFLFFEKKSCNLLVNHQLKLFYLISFYRGLINVYFSIF